MEMKPSPAAHPAAMVVSGQARFTVLTPALIRMEWSPDAAFEDRASLAFVNRRLPVPSFESVRKDGLLTLRTARLTLDYREDSGRFDADNIHVDLVVNGKEVRWHPGAADKGNLQGTARTLDGVSGSCPLEKGLLSRDGWAVVDDSESPLFDEGDPPWVTARPMGDVIDWYFFGHGHDYRAALHEFTMVAGPIPLPPRFAFGAWWSRYWAYTAEELKTLVGEFAEHGVPLDVLVIDMDWHLEGWTGYTWSPDYFPDPPGFLGWVQRQGLRTTLNLHPHDGVNRHEAAFEQVARAVGEDPNETDHIPFDCSDHRYMDAYFKYLHHPQQRQGVDFWWIDWQQGEQARIAGLDPLWWLNHLHWTDMVRNPQRGPKRPLILSRWGGLGCHRYQIGFSGDTYCNWASLAFQPYFTSTAGNVGFAFWSHDIGGHQPGPVDPELYARWIQFGAFSPALRTHTTKNPAAERRIWEFPEPVFAAALKAYQLRYELIPYIYTAAREAHDTAMPLCRPLYYFWPELDEAYERTDEYLFGDDVLVAPVCRPGEALSGCARQIVWLPPGKWINWFTGRSYEGPGEVALLVPLDEIAVFVRQGAIIPAMPPMQRSDEKPVDPLVLHVFGGESGWARMYEDDGESIGYAKGECAWIPLRLEEAAGQRTVTIGPVEGGFPGMLQQRRYELRVHDMWPPEGVTVNGSLIPRDRKATPGWDYEAGNVCTVVRIGPTPSDEAVEIAVIPFEEAAEATPLNKGLRGALSRMATVSQLLERSDWSGFAARIQEIADSHPFRASAVVEAAMDEWQLILEQAVAVANDNPGPLMMLLNLMVGTELSAVPGDDSRLTLKVTIDASPFDRDSNDVAGRLDLKGVPNWTFDGLKEWSFPWTMTDRPLRFTTTLVANARPDTAVLTGTLHLDLITHLRRRIAADQAGELPPRFGRDFGDRDVDKSEHAVELPIRQVILPSINRWWILGPFDAPSEDRLTKALPPETQVDLAATYSGKNGQPLRWQRVERPLAPGGDLEGEFFVEFRRVLGALHYDAVAYALTYLHAPREMDVTLAIGSDDGVAVWLNGVEAFRNDVGRPYRSREDRTSVRLNEGSNELLIKISQGGGMWGFGVHVEGVDGEVVPEVVARLEP